jgi:hypothetical protein
MTRDMIIITAASEMLAVEHLVSAAVTRDKPGADSGESFLLGYNVEAPQLPELIGKAVEEIHALAAEQEARVVACEVSGLHGADDGLRLWGTIECTSSPGTERGSTRVDSVMLEQAERGLWQITAMIISGEPS